MPRFAVFLWTPNSVRDIESRGISTLEFESAVLNAIAVKAARSSAFSMAVGYADTGRKLACEYMVVDEVNCAPITAYDVP